MYVKSSQQRPSKRSNFSDESAHMTPSFDSMQLTSLAMMWSFLMLLTMIL
jgi:hypothetical protein